MFFNKTLDYEKLIFHKAIKTTDGKYFIKLDKTGENVYCQFAPKLNLQSVKDSSIELLLEKKHHIEFVKDVDEFIINACKEHKISWFNNEEITDSYVEQAFMNSIKSIKKTENMLLSTRVSKDIQVFSKSKETLEKEKVKDNSIVSLICQIEGIWFTKTRFGVTWKIKQIMLHENETDIVPKFGKCLIEDDDDIEELDNVFPDQ